MAAPSVNPYLAQVRRLDEQFRFEINTKIYDVLNKLVTAIEGRLQPIDQKVVDLDAILDNITTIALLRLDQTFSPMIQAAEDRLNQFGVSFTASSTTSLTLGLGQKSLIIPVGEREAYAFGDYVAIRRTGGSEAMTGHVISHQRDIGQLNFDVVSFSGTGTFATWGLFFSAAPNVTHESNTNNPHQVTAEQIGV